ncbi:MAG: hydrogenase nickel incorporation protein HypB [Myxococcota bacterium]
MCLTCGCDEPENGEKKGHFHSDGETHHHHHHSEGETIKVERAILSENEKYAAYNRGFFDGKNIRCLNLISSPGSGKTTLLEETLKKLISDKTPCAVIEGDQQTDRDAKRIEKTGAKAHQINTGKACHLDAHQVQHALEHIKPESDSMLFIENVGNLICPTEFNLGEHERVVVLSVTEGSDKPAKYPLAFRTATAVVISKLDLLPHVDFNMDETLKLIFGLNPSAKIFRLSAKTGDGMNDWLDWLKRKG